MTGGLNILHMAQAMATHASDRHGVIANNVANADTPGFRARDLVPFADIFTNSRSNIPMRHSRPGHLADRVTDAFRPPLQSIPTGDAQSPNGNDVALETEMTKAAETRLQYEMALGIYQKSMNIIRTSLGR